MKTFTSSDLLHQNKFGLLSDTLHWATQGQPGTTSGLNRLDA